MIASAMAKLSGERAAAAAERLPVSAANQKILFALSGNVCAFLGCNRQLVEPATPHDDAAVVGHVAHIVGASRQGPRGTAALSDAERASHANLILFCRDHHAIVDAQPRTYSVQVLRQIKADHEAHISKLTQGRAESLLPALVDETLYSSLLPVTHLPGAIFHAPTPYGDSQYEEVKTSKVQYPRDSSVLVPFLLREGRLFTFYDIRRRSHPFKSVINGPAERVNAEQWWQEPEGARRYQTLLNRMLHKWMAAPLARKPLIPKTRGDVRVVEGARLESEVGDRQRATPNRANAHAISDLSPQKYHAMCFRRPRCSSRY